jgi:hypothetical protein
MDENTDYSHTRRNPLIPDGNTYAVHKLTHQKCVQNPEKCEEFEHFASLRAKNLPSA